MPLRHYVLRSLRDVIAQRGRFPHVSIALTLRKTILTTARTFVAVFVCPMISSLLWNIYTFTPNSTQLLRQREHSPHQTRGFSL